MKTTTNRLHGRGIAQFELKQVRHRKAVSAYGTSVPGRKLSELAAPYRRRHLNRAADMIECGNLLPAGTLPEYVEPAIDPSATSLWPQDFRDVQMTAIEPRRRLSWMLQELASRLARPLFRFAPQ